MVFGGLPDTSVLDKTTSKARIMDRDHMPSHCENKTHEPPPFTATILILTVKIDQSVMTSERKLNMVIIAR